MIQASVASLELSNLFLVWAEKQMNSERVSEDSSHVLNFSPLLACRNSLVIARY